MSTREDFEYLSHPFALSAVESPPSLAEAMTGTMTSASMRFETGGIPFFIILRFLSFLGHEKISVYGSGLRSLTTRFVPCSVWWNF